MTAYLSFPLLLHGKLYENTAFRSFQYESSLVLTLGELEFGASAFLTVFLSFLHSRVTSEEA